jgi:hypothetical protein
MIHKQQIQSITESLSNLILDFYKRSNFDLNQTNTLTDLKSIHHNPISTLLSFFPSLSPILSTTLTSSINTTKHSSTITAHTPSLSIQPTTVHADSPQSSAYLSNRAKRRLKQQEKYGAEYVSPSSRAKQRSDKAFEVRRAAYFTLSPKDRAKFDRDTALRAARQQRGVNGVNQIKNTALSIAPTSALRQIGSELVRKIVMGFIDQRKRDFEAAKKNGNGHLNKNIDPLRSQIDQKQQWSTLMLDISVLNTLSQTLKFTKLSTLYTCPNNNNNSVVQYQGLLPFVNVCPCCSKISKISKPIDFSVKLPFVLEKPMEESPPVALPLEQNSNISIKTGSDEGNATMIDTNNDVIDASVDQE